jgi:hypothetical protein
MPNTDNDQPMIANRPDTSRNTSWWPLIAIPLFFVLGWATNDAMANPDSTLCQNPAPTTGVVMNR